MQHYLVKSQFRENFLVIAYSFSPSIVMPDHWHDDVIKWKHFLRYWPFVWGIHRSPGNSAHKGQWHGAFMFSMICTWMNSWVNSHEAGGLRRHQAHYDIIVMKTKLIDGPTVHNSPSTISKTARIPKYPENYHLTLIFSWPFCFPSNVWPTGFDGNKYYRQCIHLGIPLLGWRVQIL